MTAPTKLVPEPTARRWRHVQRGTTYVEVSREHVQFGADERIKPARIWCAALGEWANVQGYVLSGGTRVVFYRSLEASGDYPAGTLWCRAEREFEDGRFVEIEVAPQPPVAADVVVTDAMVEAAARLLCKGYPDREFRAHDGTTMIAWQGRTTEARMILEAALRSAPPQPATAAGEAQS
jgi:hypothetical protein